MQRSCVCLVAGLLGFAAGTRAEAETVTVRPADHAAALPDPGMGWVFHYYDNVPAHYGSEQPPARDVTFISTSDCHYREADLSHFSLVISEIQSTWRSAGALRVKLTVKDARGRVFPVVGAPLYARAGKWKAELATEWGPLHEPTGWLRGNLPDLVPEALTVHGTVVAQRPKGPDRREVTARFRRGDGLVARAKAASVPASVTMLHCAFDGRKLTYLKHGDELSLSVVRGLCEPSIIALRLQPNR